MGVIEVMLELHFGCEQLLALRALNTWMGVVDMRYLLAEIPQDFSAQAAVISSVAAPIVLSPKHQVTLITRK